MIQRSPRITRQASAAAESSKMAVKSFKMAAGSSNMSAKSSKMAVASGKMSAESSATGSRSARPCDHPATVEGTNWSRPDGGGKVVNVSQRGPTEVLYACTSCKCCFRSCAALAVHTRTMHQGANVGKEVKGFQGAGELVQGGFEGLQRAEGTQGMNEDVQESDSVLEGFTVVQVFENNEDIESIFEQDLGANDAAGEASVQWGDQTTSGADSAREEEKAEEGEMEEREMDEAGEIGSTPNSTSEMGRSGHCRTAASVRQGLSESKSSKVSEFIVSQYIHVLLC